MLKFITFIFLTMSFAQAEELTVLDISARKVSLLGTTSASFVFHKDGSAGVNLEVSNPRLRLGRRRGLGGPITRNYEAEVPELSVVGDKLLYKNELECGTIKPSRVLRIPTLITSGNCELVIRKLTTEEGKRVQIVLITE